MPRIAQSFPLWSPGRWSPQWLVLALAAETVAKEVGAAVGTGLALVFGRTGSPRVERSAEGGRREQVERSAEGGRREQVERSAEGGRREQVERSAEGGRRSRVDIGLVCQEFFERELGGHGGFGRTARHLADHYNRGGSRSLLAILPNAAVDEPTRRDLDGTEGLLIPSFRRLTKSWVGFCRELSSSEPRLFVTIDYLLNYEYVFWACPRVPIVIYLRDPRGREEWSRIAGVDGAADSNHRRDRFGLERIADQHADSLHRVLRYARWLRRPVVFVTNGQFLVERARREYRMPRLVAHDLPNPLPLPELERIEYGERPMLLVLGRLDPVKRPALALALSERFPEVEFYFAGEPSYPELVRELMERYGSRPNVTFGGLAVGAEKDALFRRCWALLNTAVHEGLPVSFLEAFSYGKSVISANDPAGLVSRFGYRVHEPDAGSDEQRIAAFVAAIRRALDDEAERRARGAAAREYVREEHAIELFDQRLAAILAREGIPWS